jgi:hypothetical protein
MDSPPTSPRTRRNFALSIEQTPLVELALVNCTLNPEVPLDTNSGLGETLQRLGLWPTGHVRVARAAPKA